ncbi:MAG: hypothetical protein J7K88_05350 [Candidatus Fermentibacteraceae bacterium]|nr:hypothetical protein [Candidatus Fermentibacteraceae bacterium]
MKKIYIIVAAMLALACGSTQQTSGFFVGASTAEIPASVEETVHQVSADQPAPAPEDTLLNCSFQSVLDRPFGTEISYSVYNGALHIDNHYFDEPVVLLSRSGLVKDGLVQAVFNVTDALPHSVIGIVLRADGENNFLLLGVNGRGQYTVQRCLNGLWIPVMGMDAFETSRLLPYRLTDVELTAEVHGNYTDFSVNGQLVQVVRTSLPPTGQIGVFVDGKVDTDLDRITVIPL